MRPIGIFGGTFDPIHYGHLRTALELKLRVSLAEVRFVPSASPPHRQDALAAGASRVEMVRAAIAGAEGFVLDEREFGREGPSYTVDTLESLRDENPRTPLCLLMGMDAFLSLPEWYRWRDLISFAHIVVAHRPGWQASAGGELGKLFDQCNTIDVEALRETLCGRIYVSPVTQLEISATDLRDGIRAGFDPRYLVPDSVRRIIIDSECYAA
ncbi:MAG TPA: nicotinate-nucleotide adenylyltransferase [Gammaproteobacteria bacterium]